MKRLPAAAPESRKARADRIRLEARRVYLTDGLPLERLKAQLDEAGDLIHLSTLKRWCADGKWQELRKAAEVERDKSNFKKARKALRDKLPTALTNLEANEEKLLDRSIRLLLNGNDYCKECGHGPDTKHKGAVLPSLRDVVALGKHRLELLGYGQMGGAGGGDGPALDAFPELPAEFIAELGDLLAKHESLPAVRINPETGAVGPADAPADEEYVPDDG